MFYIMKVKGVLVERKGKESKMDLARGFVFATCLNANMP